MMKVITQDMNTTLVRQNKKIENLNGHLETTQRKQDVLLKDTKKLLN